MNESLSVEDHDGELVLKPMGLGIFDAERDSLMSAKQATEYLWKMACQYLINSHKVVICIIATNNIKELQKIHAAYECFLRIRQYLT